MQYLTIWDLILTPIYLIILVAIAKRQRDKWYPVGNPLREYYLKGLYVKFFGAIFIALVYQYYYGGGDTYNFFSHAKIINSSLDKGFEVWFDLVMRKSPEQNPAIYEYSSQMYWYEDTASYVVCIIAAIFGLLNGTSYIPIALLFAFFSYTGIWAMYRTFVNIYPSFHKQLAIAFLFIPSTFVWGSAIFKDTICMFGLGWMVYTTFRVFVNRDFSIKNIFLLILSFFLLATIKLYILLAFLPALSIWLLTTYSRRISSSGLRMIINLSFVVITGVSFYFLSGYFAEEMSRYSLDKIAQTAQSTRGWIGYVSDVEGGSGYDLGEFDPSIGGMLVKFPQAVVVTLFRPFPWEVSKVIVALSALESLIFLYLTLKVLFVKRKMLGSLFKDSNVLFFFVFSIIFAFAVGITSYNFGSLSRYKIPCLPFYGAMLTVLLYNDKRIVEQEAELYENRPENVPSYL